MDAGADGHADGRGVGELLAPGGHVELVTGEPELLADGDDGLHLQVEGTAVLDHGRTGDLAEHGLGQCQQTAHDARRDGRLLTGGHGSYLRSTVTVTVLAPASASTVRRPESAADVTCPPVTVAV